MRYFEIRRPSRDLFENFANILFPRSWELLAIRSLECPALWGPQLQRFQPLNVKLPNRLQGLTKQFSQRRHKRVQTIMPSYPPLPSRPTHCNHPLNHQCKANHFRRNAHSRSERNGMAKKAARLLTATCLYTQNPSNSTSKNLPRNSGSLTCKTLAGLQGLNASDSLTNHPRLFIGQAAAGMGSTSISTG